MRDPDTPDYLEAYPIFSMQEATRRPMRTRYVTWFNEAHDEIGSAEITHSDFAMRMKYFFKGRHGELPNIGFEHLTIRPVPRGSHNYRFAVLCRVCGKCVSRLFYRIEHWACQQCQGLRNRSTYLSPQLRWQDEYNNYRYMLVDGRPPGMRAAEYHRKRERMLELRGKLDGTGRVPGPEFWRTVYDKWSDTDPEA